MKAEMVKMVRGALKGWMRYAAEKAPRNFHRMTFYKESMEALRALDAASQEAPEVATLQARIRQLEEFLAESNFDRNLAQLQSATPTASQPSERKGDA